MKKKLVFILVFSIIFVFSSVAAAAEIPVSKSSSSQNQPHTYGNYVVWADERHNKAVTSGFNPDIYLKDVKYNKEIAVCVDKNIQSNPKVNNKHVVWQDSRNGMQSIYICDLFITRKGVVAWNVREIPKKPDNNGYTSYHRINPDLFMDKVVWSDNRNGNWDIYMYDLISKVETRITTNTKNQENPVISGSNIAWKDYRNNKNAIGEDIYMYTMGKSESRVTPVSGLVCGNPIIYGNAIIFQFVDKNYSDNILLYNISAKKLTKQITNTSQYSIHGRKIVYVKYNVLDKNIYVKDISSGVSTPVCTEKHSQDNPVIFGNRVVWEDYRSGISNIYMKYIDLTPPTAYATPKGTTYSTAKAITLKMNETGIIFYTINGTTPNIKSTKYTKPIIIKNNTTLRFIALDVSGNISQVYNEKYVIK